MRANYSTNWVLNTRNRSHRHPQPLRSEGEGAELKGLPWTDWWVVKRNEPLLRPEEAPGGVATGGGVLTDFPHSLCPFMAAHIQWSQWIPLGDCG